MYYNDHMDYEPPEDPIFEAAASAADFQLDSIADDLDQEAYEKAWQETYEKELARLKAERAEEIARYNAMTSEEKAAWDEHYG